MEPKPIDWKAGVQYDGDIARAKQVLNELDKYYPDAKFVCATLGQTEKGAEGNDGLILAAQLAVDGETGKYPEFKGNVATVYSHPLSLGHAFHDHDGGNAETYMNIGETMGRAMAEKVAAMISRDF